MVPGRETDDVRAVVQRGSVEEVLETAPCAHGRPPRVVTGVRPPPVGQLRHGHLSTLLIRARLRRGAMKDTCVGSCLSFTVARNSSAFLSSPCAINHAHQR